MNYTVDGPEGGEVVVLSGSLGSDLNMWQPQVEPLTDAGFRVLRYDHRGHGASAVPPGPYRLDQLGGDVLALLDSLRISRAHVVGLSLGGAVAMWLGRYAPQRVHRLVLCCTAANFGAPENWLQRAELVRAGGVEAVADAVLERWVTGGYRTAHPERVAGLREMIAATPAEGYASCCEAIAELDLTPELPAISAPALVLAGAQDPATPPETGQRIADGIPGCRMEVLDPGAHLVNVERPERVSELIIDWLRTEEAA